MDDEDRLLFERFQKLQTPLPRPPNQPIASPKQAPDQHATDQDLIARHSRLKSKVNGNNQPPVTDEDLLKRFEQLKGKPTSHLESNSKQFLCPQPSKTEGEEVDDLLSQTSDNVRIGSSLPSLDGGLDELHQKLSKLRGKTSIPSASVNKSIDHLTEEEQIDLLMAQVADSNAMDDVEETVLKSSKVTQQRMNQKEQQKKKKKKSNCIGSE